MEWLATSARENNSLKKVWFSIELFVFCSPRPGSQKGGFPATVDLVDPHAEGGGVSAGAVH